MYKKVKFATIILMSIISLLLIPAGISMAAVNMRPTPTNVPIRVLPTFPPPMQQPVIPLPTLVKLPPQNPGPRKPAPQPPPTAVYTVAFGDSNTTNWITTNWYERLQAKTTTTLAVRYHVYYYQNLSLGGRTVTPILNEQGQNMQYEMDSALTQVTQPIHVAYVQLGTNDAWQGAPVADFVIYFKQMINKIKVSGKMASNGNVVIMSVPPMISPYNCIGMNCWRNTHNPQTERVVPYNQQLAQLPTYCTSIGLKCVYVNAANGVLLNTTYLNAGDGVHLTSAGQDKFMQNIYNWLATVSFR